MDRSISRRSRRRVPPTMESLEGRALLSVVGHPPDGVDRPVQAVSNSSEATATVDQPVHLLMAPTEGTTSAAPPVHLPSTLAEATPSKDQSVAPSQGTPADDQSVHLLAATSGLASSDDQAVPLIATTSGGAPTDDQSVHMLAATSGLAATDAQAVPLIAPSSGGAPTDDQAMRLLAASSSEVTPSADPPVHLISAPSDSSAQDAPPVHLISAASERIELDGTVRGKLRQWQGATIGSQPGFAISGVGQHATVGRARVDGFIMPTSVEANASATLTLKTSRGNVTLALQALPETSARPALAYRYTLQKGTGTYRDATATGTATLSLPQGLPRSGSRVTSFSFLLQSDRTRS